MADSLPERGDRDPALQEDGDSEESTTDWRFVGDCVGVALGVFALLIWVVSFAVTVTLVEVNRCFPAMDCRLESLDHAARQSVYQPASAPGLGVMAWDDEAGPPPPDGR